jgi:hypothetical protein
VAAQRPGLQHARSQAASDLVPDAVTRDRGERDHGHDGEQAHVASAGVHATQDGGGLAGDDEPHEQRILDEHQRAHQDVDVPGGRRQQQVHDAVHRYPPCHGHGRRRTTAANPACPTDWNVF